MNCAAGSRFALSFSDGERGWMLGVDENVSGPVRSSAHELGRGWRVTPTVWWIAEGRTHPYAAVTTDAGKS